LGIVLDFMESGGVFARGYVRPDGLHTPCVRGYVRPDGLHTPCVRGYVALRHTPRKFFSMQIDFEQIRDL
jgi:hypothetical protein